jgi:nucleoid-associated protein YgaU
MQPIERYGVISLLALVVIITAVVLWDQADDEQPVLAAASKVEQGPAGLNRNAVPPQKPAAKGQVPIQSSGWNADNTKATRQAKDQDALKLDKQLDQALSELNKSKPQPTPNTMVEAPQAKDEARINWMNETAKANGTSNPLAYETDSLPEKSLGSAVIEPKSTARTYIVKSGDTLSQIAQRELGSVTFTDELKRANPKVEETRMTVGTRLNLPAVTAEMSAALAAKADTAPASTSAPRETKSTTLASNQYRVKEGDSLWSIAAKQLGSGERYTAIEAANPGINSNKLLTGQLITLPASSGGEIASNKAPSASASKATAPRSESKSTSKKGVVL